MSFPIEFPELRTNRLTLRKITANDIIPMIEIAGFKIQNPTEKDALDYIERVDQDFRHHIGITWAMDFQGEMIGSIGYYRGFENRTGEIGYVMCESHKRRGFMSEAIVAAINFGFDELSLKRITAYTEISNKASVNLLLKLGFNDTKKDHDKYRIFDIEPG
ncbi:MAG: GNAT family N-acetyltransferase [Flavobacteriales bacterium]